MFGPFAQLSLLAIIAIVTMPFALACQRPLPSQTDDPTVYQDRGEHCEGLYVQKFGGRDSIEIVGLHAGPIEFPDKMTKLVKIAVPSVGSPEVAVKIEDVIPTKFYQFDFVRSVSSAPDFLWDLSIVRDPKVNLRAQDLAALGCLGSCEADVPELVAVKIGDDLSWSGSAVALLVFVPQATEKLDVSLVDAQSGEKLSTPLSGLLRRNTGAVVRIPLDVPQARQSAQIVLHATLDGGAIILKRANLHFAAE